MTFEDVILTIVNAHSGGVKMTELISDIFVEMSKLPKEKKPQELDALLITSTFDPGVKSGDLTSPVLDALDHKLKEMAADGKIGLLHYGWDMGMVVRVKTFIYCPLEPGES